MTYHQLQKDIVEDKKLLTKAKFNRLLLLFSIFTITLLFCALTLCLVTLPTQWLVVVILLFLILYSTVLTSLTTSEQAIKTLQKVCRVWWLPIILFFIENFILRYLHFL